MSFEPPMPGITITGFRAASPAWAARLYRPPRSGAGDTPTVQPARPSVTMSATIASRPVRITDHPVEDREPRGPVKLPRLPAGADGTRTGRGMAARSHG